MHWASFWNQTTPETEPSPHGPHYHHLCRSKQHLVFFTNLQGKKQQHWQTNAEQKATWMTTEQSGKTCLDRADRLLSVISAYLAAALTASAGRASPGRAQKDGERACLRPESREKAPASSSQTVWFSLLDKHSECWSMSHPQAAISALSRRPTAQLSLSLSLSLSLTV